MQRASERSFAKVHATIARAAAIGGGSAAHGDPAARCRAAQRLRLPAQRGHALLLACALALTGCTNMATAGMLIEIEESFRAGECAMVLDKVAESTSFLQDRPERLAQAYFYKARCLARMGRRDEAAALFLYITEQHPTTPFAYEAQALRAQLLKE